MAINLSLQGGHRFFINFQGEEGYLPPEEGLHAVKVLRKEVGELIKLIDGKGTEYLGQIVNLSWKKRTPWVRVKIIEILRRENIPPISLKVLIPFLKGDKTEFLVEKATELGMTNLLLYQSKHTILRKRDFKKERFHEKALAALKQSGRLYLPEITFVDNLSNFLESLSEEKSLKLLAHPQGTMDLLSLLDWLKNPPSQIILLSGPEGDLSPEELSLAKIKGFQTISLSPYVLRAETACISLMCLISSLIFLIYKIS